MIIFSIPTVNSIDQVKASNLFRNVFQSLQFNYSVKSVIISLVLLLILISLFAIRSSIPFYSVAYFVSFFICLLIFYYLSVTIIYLLKKYKNSRISVKIAVKNITQSKSCLLYTSPSPRDGHQSRMPSSA